MAAALREKNPFSASEIDKWTNGGQAIFAGQQVGFAGGPLYTLAKIATIVRMKRDLEKSGQPATAFFWLATEDHDWDEAATLYVPAKDRQTDLAELRAIRTNGRHAMVGPQPIPESLIVQLLALLGIERPQWLREGITFGESFAELIAEVFGGEVVLVDSL
ncbi:MAG TPA: bacillithiol biosynthesis BshC, partial [Thermoanaerobaculia bacterium]|nr:bacillithiol biosynthesis BshC [Thermoanaerobaculia bacterium]